MNILFVSSEAVPFAATGGLADVAGALPKALCQLGEDCRVILPLYAQMAPELRAELTFCASFNVPLGWRNQYCGLFKTVHGGVTYYFLDNEYYFKRGTIYGQYDDGERFAFFSKAVWEAIPHLDFAPDVLHCNDWQSALVPVYGRIQYAFDYPRIKTVFTIHNIQFQGRYSIWLGRDVLGISAQNQELVRYGNDVNYMKGAIETAERVTTVSPGYAKEILDPYFGYGLDGFLRERSEKLSGILNGIDTQLYDPQKNPDLYAHFSPKDLAGKGENKRRLRQELGLADDLEKPLLSLVSRLTEQKGLDLLLQELEEILGSGVQVAILGSGEERYQNALAAAAARHPGQMAFVQGFIPNLAQKIYAGSDLFLMPSLTEPCGLAQMVALRYGTIPIVRKTGGLADTVQDMDEGGVGYTFHDYNPRHMADSIYRALAAFGDAPGWAEKVRRAMACEFGWENSAKSYQSLYESLFL